MCRIRMPCAWPWSGGAKSGIKRRRWPVATILSAHAQTRDVTVQELQLDTYDQLTKEQSDEQAT